MQRPFRRVCGSVTTFSSSNFQARGGRHLVKERDLAQAAMLSAQQDHVKLAVVELPQGREHETAPRAARVLRVSTPGSALDYR